MAVQIINRSSRSRRNFYGNNAAYFTYCTTAPCAVFHEATVPVFDVQSDQW